MKTDRYKFRGKRTEGGEWVYGYCVVTDERHYIFTGKTGFSLASPTHVIRYKDFGRYEVIPDSVGQFTGLYDIKDREIYEGDAVRWDDCSNGKYWRFAIVEINPSLQFNCNPIKVFNDVENSADIIFEYGRFRYTQTEKYLEIIGNVHDNPDLLTAK
jgi:uncharacterized phage protein (TIGR01671 family)